MKVKKLKFSELYKKADYETKKLIQGANKDKTKNYSRLPGSECGPF